jgi:hypothetical protein
MDEVTRSRQWWVETVYGRNQLQQWWTRRRNSRVRRSDKPVMGEMEDRRCCTMRLHESGDGAAGQLTTRRNDGRRLARRCNKSARWET